MLDEQVRLEQKRKKARQRNKLYRDLRKLEKRFREFFTDQELFEQLKKVGKITLGRAMLAVHSKKGWWFCELEFDSELTMQIKAKPQTWDPAIKQGMVTEWLDLCSDEWAAKQKISSLLVAALKKLEREKPRMCER